MPHCCPPLYPACPAGVTATQGRGSRGGGGNCPPNFLSEGDEYACAPPKFWQSLGISTCLPPPPPPQEKNRSRAPAATLGVTVGPTWAQWFSASAFACESRVYIEPGRHGFRPPIFAWRKEVASPAGKPPGESPNNHLRRSVTFAGHFARNTSNRIFNILSIIYVPSCSASIITGGRHPRQPDSMET